MGMGLVPEDSAGLAYYCAVLIFRQREFPLNFGLGANDEGGQLLPRHSPDKRRGEVLALQHVDFKHIQGILIEHLVAGRRSSTLV